MTKVTLRNVEKEETYRQNRNVLHIADKGFDKRHDRYEKALRIQKFHQLGTESKTDPAVGSTVIQTSLYCLRLSARAVVAEDRHTGT